VRRLAAFLRFLADVCDDDALGTVLRESPGDSPTDARTSTGDDGHVTTEE
jgi:hypothetical protein